MIERDPMFGRDAIEESEPFDLRETLAHWTEPAQEEGPSEEERLANFLEALNNNSSQIHDANGNRKPVTTGRRGAPRLRLSLPARLTSIERTHQAILLNLSRTGALVAILDAVREGEGGILECGNLKVFGVVARSEFSLNALRFDKEISDEKVLEMRRFYENFEVRERRQLIETARKWVNGDTKDERAM